VVRARAEPPDDLDVALVARLKREGPQRQLCRGARLLAARHADRDGMEEEERFARALGTARDLVDLNRQRPRVAKRQPVGGPGAVALAHDGGRVRLARARIGHRHEPRVRRHAAGGARFEVVRGPHLRARAGERRGQHDDRRDRRARRDGPAAHAGTGSTFWLSRSTFSGS
jgi:hypothetical protein